jgi:hypothetical protein
MRYAIETSGPDTFKVRVVRKGNISQIQYRRPLPFRPGGPPPGGPATELVPPTSLPLNQRLVLIMTGTRLSNVEVRPETTYQNVRVLPGATESTYAVEIEFTGSGQGPLSFFDSALSGQDMRSSGSSKFSYTGGAIRNVQYGGAQAGGTTFTPPILRGGAGSPSVFVDVAPRANMLNIFRRASTNPAFTRRRSIFFHQLRTLQWSARRAVKNYHCAESDLGSFECWDRWHRHAVSC